MVRDSGGRLSHVRAQLAVPWAYTGPVAAAIAARRAPLRPILVLSMPRSGSSWVGATLGRARNAAYLREPLTHNWARLRQQPAVIEVDPSSPPDSYRRNADFAFSGIPRFPREVVVDRPQWRVWQTARRVVIKEVNPLAVRWLVTTYQPDLIYLVRHPAATAESTARQGWVVDGYGGLFLPSRRASGTLREADVGDGLWTRLGAVQAHAAHEVAAVVDAATSSGIRVRIQSYERLCADPVGEFHALFDFAGLRWEASAEAAVRVASSTAPTDMWRSVLSASQIADVRRGYLMFDPPDHVTHQW